MTTSVSYLNNLDNTLIIDTTSEKNLTEHIEIIDTQKFVIDPTIIDNLTVKAVDIINEMNSNLELYQNSTSLLMTPVFFKIVDISIHFADYIQTNYDPNCLPQVYDELYSKLRIQRKYASDPKNAIMWNPTSLIKNNSTQTSSKQTENLYSLYRDSSASDDQSLIMFRSCVDLCKIIQHPSLNVASDVVIIVQIMTKLMEEKQHTASDMVSIFIYLLYALYHNLYNTSETNSDKLLK